MPADQQRAYEVGYGKPPRHARFQKGRSGNPRGRPRGSKNLSTLLNEALNELVLVTENRGRRKITKLQVMITQLVNKAAQGHWPAVKILLDIHQAIESRTEPASPETSAFSAADEKVIAQLRARFARSET
jgi:Family of unknown function (DUF5681)